ncbi:MAG: hypothetical protein AAF709_24685, partial [Pseudomonadota bacterium]
MSDPTFTLTLATDVELLDARYRLALQWSVFWAGIGHRAWPTQIQDDLREAYECCVQLQYAPVPFEIPLVDHVAHERFVRDFMNGKELSLAAVRLIDFHFRWERFRAEHFERCKNIKRRLINSRDFTVLLKVAEQQGDEVAAELNREMVLSA